MICSAAQGTFLFRALSGPCGLKPDPAFVTAPRVTASGAASCLWLVEPLLRYLSLWPYRLRSPSATCEAHTSCAPCRQALQGPDSGHRLRRVPSVVPMFVCKGLECANRHMNSLVTWLRSCARHFSAARPAAGCHACVCSRGATGRPCNGVELSVAPPLLVYNRRLE